LSVLDSSGHRPPLQSLHDLAALVIGNDIAGIEEEPVQSTGAGELVGSAVVADADFVEQQPEPCDAYGIAVYRGDPSFQESAEENGIPIEGSDSSDENVV